jgi:hypothetical protein
LARGLRRKRWNLENIVFVLLSCADSCVGWMGLCIGWLVGLERVRRFSVVFLASYVSWFWRLGFVSPDWALVMALVSVDLRDDMG